MTILTLFISPLCFAKAITLYDQPKPDAKIVGAIDAASGMVPIYAPKTGDWIKVGNPHNGDVGWLKMDDLVDKSGSISTGFSITQRTIITSKGPRTYQLVQFSIPTVKP